MKPLLTLGLALVILLAAVTAASAWILQLNVDPVRPLAGEAVTFTVKGEQPTPCYKRVVDAARTRVEDRVIHLGYDVEPSTLHPCITVVTGFELPFAFPDGFSVGSYEIRVTERLYDHAGKYQEFTQAYAFVIDRTASGLPNATSGWGAVKALYGRGAD